MGGEEVIELSVEETNKLRAELGLAPLRLNNNNRNNDVDEKQHQQEPQEMTMTSSGDNNSNNNTKEGEGEEKEVLEMSIDETNRLRAKLGLKPLRTSTTTGGGDDDDKAKKDKIIHKPAVNDEKANEMKQKLEHARLKRDVDRGVVKTFGSSTLADTNDDEDNNNNNNNTLSWADRMRKQQEEGEENGTTKDETKKKKKKKKGSSSKKKGSSGGNDDNGDGGNYTSKELEGVHVAHNLTELQSGSTTVLTLADASILDTSGGGGNVGLNENDVALENVNLQEQKKTKDGLRKKRLLELGMGRAGGYSGFDDEEFEELGGTLGPARKERGGNPDYEDDDDEGGPKSKGFTIGSSETTAANQQMSDFDKISSGKAISLRPTKADVVASDYMTIEEEQKEAEERAKKKKKKDGKFKKNKKKKKDKKKKRRGRTVMVDSDDDEEAEGSGANINGVDNNANEQKNANSLLEQLEKTAGNKEESTNTNLRKRRRSESKDEEDGGGDDGKAIVKQEDGNHHQKQEGPKQKRSRYEEIMQKGNERTKLAFQDPKPKEENTNSDIDEPDDSFLNAALEKARRLNRLRELNQKRKKGAEVVADAVQSIVKQEEEQQQQSNKNEASSGTLTFAIDDTREFTRAIRARSQQNERKTLQKAKQQKVGESANDETHNKDEEQEKKAADPSSSDVKVEDVPVDGDDEEDVDMEELAKEVKIDDDDTPGFGDATASATGVGRGLSSFVSMLKQTGEINTKRGNKEELRGRAKDERNYQNYEAMDLSKVVKIGRNATDKDKEMAEREIKLEYRDKYGRLLTQKAAYRELCYQFHGHGANKKNEEKQLRQIERERAEGRLASRQVVAARDGTAAGTLGALKATQKATGKAFIVHKT